MSIGVGQPEEELRGLALRLVAKVLWVAGGYCTWHADAARWEEMHRDAEAKVLAELLAVLPDET